ncbi:MAG: double-strand break repair protein AddB, partial [Alphaproteobacteria bacterium]|nr:double-strand break repair protein AddB [Alphaproteobacteria bacterium]
MAPGVPFVDALARGVLNDSRLLGLARDARGHADPLALARVTILLPTRRACRSLRDAFLRATDGAPLLLPRMMPLGDVDGDEIELRSDAEELTPPDSELPPALSSLRRQLLLTRLILAAEPTHADHAAQLARELARLLDQVATERLELTALRTLVPDDYAAHWQKTLAFLDILIERWPAVLRQEDAVDAAERRNRVLAAQAALWRDQPPADPVIAAGTTGSIPATADLLAVIASLPRGAIVLPGLDRAMRDDAWDELDAGHPQFGLKALLERLAVPRGAVVAWPAYGLPVTNPSRARWLGCALLPAAKSDDWRHRDALPDAPLSGVARLDCASPQEEAGVIALALRETLETPGATAALVTPDRDLARRVAAELGRFGIAIDDSAGVPLDQTPSGVFLRLIAAAATAEDAPVPLLALLKHPLAAAGQEPGAFRRRVRAFEITVLRGPRPGVRLDKLADVIARDDTIAETRRARLVPLVTRLAELLMPLGSALTPRHDRADDRIAVDEVVRQHVAVAEALAASADEDGAARLWAGDAGEAAARWIAALLDAVRGFPAIKGGDYAQLFDSLMVGQVVRPHYGRHPRLAILGPLEARLQHADRMVLGGLNEGTWPAEPPVDAWLSRPMRQTFGLPAPERRIGLAAHDFAQAFAAPEVLLTRASKVDGAPTVPSRWLQRLATVLEAAGQPPLGDGRWLAWYRGHALAPQAQPCQPPEPRPPIAA